jgi:hypothetical protein
VTSDETGTARTRIRTKTLATNQTALLKITDTVSGAFREVSFTIAQFNGNTPPYFTLPSAVSFTGPYTGQCASDGYADVVIFGGLPPYRIVGTSGAYSLSNTVVGASGDTFRVTLNPGVCIGTQPIAITDAAGRTISVTVSSVQGTGTAPPERIGIAPVPTSLACSFGTSPVTLVSSSFTITGGTGTFSASSDHPRVTASVAGRTLTLTRLNGDPPPTLYSATATIVITDGSTGPLSVSVAVPQNCP